MENEELKKVAEENLRSRKMIFEWAKKQGNGILNQMERNSVKETLNIFWPKARPAWLGGFVNGVQAGFDLGSKTSQNLLAPFLKASMATLSGTEAEAIEKKNAEIKELLGTAIGEASMCWKETPTGVFDSEKAQKIVEKLMTYFALTMPTPKETPKENTQERLPGI